MKRSAQKDTSALEKKIKKKSKSKSVSKKGAKKEKKREQKKKSKYAGRTNYAAATVYVSDGKLLST